MKIWSNGVIKTKSGPKSSTQGSIQTYEAELTATQVLSLPDCTIPCSWRGWRVSRHIQKWIREWIRSRSVCGAEVAAVEATIRDVPEALIRFAFAAWMGRSMSSMPPVAADTLHPNEAARCHAPACAVCLIFSSFLPPSLKGRFTCLFICQAKW